MRFVSYDTSIRIILFQGKNYNNRMIEIDVCNINSQQYIYNLVHMLKLKDDVNGALYRMKRQRLSYTYKFYVDPTMLNRRIIQPKYSSIMTYNQDSRTGRASSDDNDGDTYNEASIGLISEQPRKSSHKELCSKTLLIILLIISNAVWIVVISRTWYGTRDLLETCGNNKYPADFGMCLT